MVIAISLIFDIYVFSFLGLSVCGDDFEILRHSCEYLTDCSESSCRFICHIIKSALFAFATVINGVIERKLVASLCIRIG